MVCFYPVFRLKLLNRIHEKLTCAATIVNESHGPVLLASFGVYFLTACAHTRTIYLTAGDKSQGVDFLVEFLWLIFILGKYIYVVDACHKVTVQVSSFHLFLSIKIFQKFFKLVTCI